MVNLTYKGKKKFTEWFAEVFLKEELPVVKIKKIYLFYSQKIIQVIN